MFAVVLVILYFVGIFFALRAEYKVDGAWLLPLIILVGIIAHISHQTQKEEDEEKGRSLLL